MSPTLKYSEQPCKIIGQDLILPRNAELKATYANKVIFSMAVPTSISA